jgi:hypothetical protein
VNVRVLPETFAMVLFDGEAIARVVAEVAARVGVDRDIVVEVDERTPLGRTYVESLDPVTIKVESGAFEDARRPRNLSETGVRDAVGRLLFRVKDRLDPAFGAPPADADLSLPAQVAWDAYCVGRCARLGLPAQEQRRRYHFRNRHGFTDVADAMFERLWNGDGLTWADIEAACAATERARAAVSPGRGR